MLTNAERLREWRRQNPEKNREYKRRHYHKHKAAVLARSKAEYYADVEETRKKKNAWRKIADAANPELAKARRKKTRETRRFRMHFSSVRCSARLKGAAFDLTPEWFYDRHKKGVCELSGIPFSGIGGRNKNGPSVDRRIPGGPYTQDNCRMVIWALNSAMSNHGEEYMFDVFRRVIAIDDASKPNATPLPPHVAAWYPSRDAYAGYH